MRIKAVLFDIDGVMVRPPYYFGRELEDNGYENAESVLKEFFTEKNKACTEGKTDIKKEILPYLERLGWDKGVDDFFKEQYRFESEFYDLSFVQIIQALQQQGIYCALATSQEYCRAEFFLKELGYEELFDGHYISCNIGGRKNFPEYWEYLLKDLEAKFPGIVPEEIAFFDDQQVIVDRASTFGIQALLFTDMQRFYKDLESLGLKL